MLHGAARRPEPEALEGFARVIPLHKDRDEELDLPVGEKSVIGDPLERVKRRVYLASLVISAPSLPLLWLTLGDEDPFVYFVFPPMALFCVWCAVSLWRNRMPIHKIERLTFVAVSTFAFLHLIHSPLKAGDLSELREAVDLTTFPTLIVLYVIAYLIFDTGTGLRASLLLYSGSLILVVASAAWWGPAILEKSEVSWVAQKYAFMGAVVALLYATAFAKSQLSRERALTEAMSRLALTDQLTGICNRRKLYIDLQREIQEAARYNRPLSVILFDLDHFKAINDTHGHACGDEVLKEVVHAIKPLLRKTDHFGRWGGEEFILVTPETNLERATNLAERLRNAISECSPQLAERVTASFGIAQYTPRDTPESLVKHADKALYEAKENGKNRVKVNGTR
ncbi:MAG: GGDEF domain-containing protein [Rubrobacteraceae bacterium]